MALDSLLFISTALSAREKEVEVPDETTFSAGIVGPEPVLPGWLRCILGDDNQQFHTHNSPDDNLPGNLGAIADTYNGPDPFQVNFLQHYQLIACPTEPN